MKPFKNPNPINKIGEMINTGVAMISARIIGNKKSSTKKAIKIKAKFKTLKLITENSAVIIFLKLRFLSALLIA